MLNAEDMVDPAFQEYLKMYPKMMELDGELNLYEEDDEDLDEDSESYHDFMCRTDPEYGFFHG